MKFIQPFTQIKKQDGFSQSEPGLTHPNFPSSIVLNNNQDIDLTAKPGVGIVVSGAGSIMITADKIKFITKENGLTWNGMKFNQKAVKFNEPMLVAKESTPIYGV